MGQEHPQLLADHLDAQSVDRANDGLVSVLEGLQPFADVVPKLPRDDSVEHDHKDVMAVSGVIYAIFLQRAELRAQRQELKDTREVVKQQREEMTLQNETLRQQTFENSFFQLLRFHRETVRYLQASPGQSVAVFNGVSALQAAAAEIAHQVSTLRPIDPKDERVV